MPRYTRCKYTYSTEGKVQAKGLYSYLKYRPEACTQPPAYLECRPKACTYTESTDRRSVLILRVQAGGLYSTVYSYLQHRPERSVLYPNPILQPNLSSTKLHFYNFIVNAQKKF